MFKAFLLFLAVEASWGFMASPSFRGSTAANSQSGRFQVSTARFSSIAASDDFLMGFSKTSSSFLSSPPKYFPTPPSTEIPTLQTHDFPDYFRNMMHPRDGQLSDIPMEPKLIWHRPADYAPYRLLVRMSVKVNNNKFMPLTFVCDTKNAFTLHLSRPALDTLQAVAGRKMTQPELATPNGKVSQHSLVLH